MFHLAIPTHDLNLAKEFFGDGLGLVIGREQNSYVIVNFFGHQVVCHLAPDEIESNPKMYPRHFGLIVIEEQKYEELLMNAREKKLDFFKDDFKRFQGKESEHRSFFLLDPSNNLIEFKWYKKQSAIF